MTLNDFRAKLGAVMAEVDREIKAEAKPQAQKPKASGSKTAKPKASPRPKAEVQPKAEEPKAEPKKAKPKAEEPKAEPKLARFVKGFTLDASLDPIGIVGKKQPRMKWQAEGLSVGTEGTEAKVYAYLPVGKVEPTEVTAIFDGKSKGSKAVFKAEDEEGFAFYVYLPVAATKANKLAVVPSWGTEGTEAGHLKLSITKA